MAVSLPTAADVRKLREQAAKNAADRAEAARAPLMAVLGAGEHAVNTVTKVIADARARAEAAQKRFADLPTEVEDLRTKLASEEIRKTVEEWRTQATKYYEDLAKRGEVTWAEIRKQPRIQQALNALESYTEKLDAQVDEFVDEAHDAAEKAVAHDAAEKAVAEVAEKTPAKPAEPAKAAEETPAGRAAGRTAPKTATRSSTARRPRSEDTASS
ncbi:hypothetical protein [Pseudonocardia asaccharolytica]|nr:hypothetical protein [Pseudonocardia asaccharolytica]